jgi:hypothetical protein
MDTTTIYVQTSSTELGYQIPPKMNYPVTYAFANVQKYVTGNYCVLWTGVPVTDPRLFLGVSEYDKTYRDLEYISVSPFFERPAGDEGGFGSADGQIPFGRLLDGFLGVLEQRQGLPRDRPFFTVLDSNAAHHVSATLAAFAFNRSPDQRKRVIFNFDHHPDYGYGGKLGLESPISCQTWGQFTLASFDTRPRPIANVYVVTGVAERMAEYQQNPGGGKLLTLTGTTIHQQVDALLRNVLRVTVDQVDLYVSIDRDFMAGSFTTYDDGIYSADAGRRMVGDLLDAMRGARLVGFDIVGLPAVAGRSKSKPEYKNNQGCMTGPDCPWEQARADIEVFQAMVANFPSAAIAAQRAAARG